MKKCCTSCGNWLPLDAFGRDATSADGRKSQCKVCRGAARRAAYRGNSAAEIARSRAYYARNAELARERQRRYREAHPEQVAKDAKVRAERERRARGSHTYAQWIALVIAYDFRCLGCGKQFLPGEEYRGLANLPLTEDHVRPLAKGGSNAISNIQPLCKGCNSAKGARTIDYRPGWLRVKRVRV